jgi:tetratricopeptide (TPR) repeat protein
MSITVRFRKSRSRLGARTYSRWAQIVLAALILPGQLTAAQPPRIDDATACPKLEVDPNNIRDYRARDSNSTQKWGIDDNMANHMGPAIEHIRAGEYSHRVIADINFTLAHWPNHLLALQYLTRYDLGGGKQYEFMSTACFFARARQFAPDDVGVILLDAYYSWKKGDTAGAISLYEAALKVDPDSADAHYNLGLMYIKLGNYAKASEEAQAAYGSGYPLPGLREKLIAAGYPAADYAERAQSSSDATDRGSGLPLAPVQ